MNYSNCVDLEIKWGSELMHQINSGSDSAAVKAAFVSIRLCLKELFCYQLQKIKRLDLYLSHVIREALHDPKTFRFDLISVLTSTRHTVQPRWTP